MQLVSQGPGTKLAWGAQSPGACVRDGQLDEWLRDVGHKYGPLHLRSSSSLAGHPVNKASQL